MIHFSIIHKSYFGCFEDCIISILEYYKKNYMIVFGQSWRPLPWSHNISNNLKRKKMNYNLCMVAEQYMGIKTDIRTFDDFALFHEYLLYYIKLKIPIIIYVDMFDLPWSDYYKKVHDFHCIIVLGHKSDTVFYVCDATLELLGVELDLKGVFAGKMQVLTIINNKETVKFSAEEYFYECDRILRAEFQGSNYEELLSSGLKLLSDEEILFQYDRENVESEKFINDLLQLGRGRIAFAEAFQTFADIYGYPGYEEMLDHLKRIGAKWNSFKMKVMKARLKNEWNQKKRDLMQQMELLISEEYQAFNEFSNVNKLKKRNTGKEIYLHHYRKHKLSLERYFNSNAFNSVKWNNGGFDGAGYFYEAGPSAMINGPVYDRLDVDLLKEMDHIRCMNQVIRVGMKGIKAVSITGSCDRGNYSENLSMLYEDGAKTVDLSFSDWWEAKGIFGEKTILRFNCCREEKGDVVVKGDVYLYQQVLDLRDRKDKFLKSITLPDCWNMHIFEIIIYD